LDTYPWIESKVEMLMRSIEDVGFWEGVIVRAVGKRFELAFGHHRLEAARRLGLKRVPVIIRDLSDEEMLKLMGRENGEDYSTDFLVMLNTWQGAVEFCSSAKEHTPDAVEIARLLGWDRERAGKRPAQSIMNATAEACSAAYSLLQGGYLDMDDLEGLSVKAAKEIVQRANAHMKRIEKAGRARNRPPREVEAVKGKVAQGAKVTARKARRGEVAQKDLRGEVDANTYRAAAASKAPKTLLFETFGKTLADSIEKMLSSDATSTKLAEVVKALPHITMAEDAEVLRRLDFELEQLGQRTANWQKRLTPKKAEVISLVEQAKERRTG